MEKRREHILLSALTCFCSTGIDGTTVAVVAKAAGVGEATIYRYFTNKTELVMQTGRLIWQSATKYYSTAFSNASHTNKTGIEQLKSLLDIYLTLYDEHSEIFRFIYDFDNYVLKQSFAAEDRSRFTKSVHSLKYFFHQAVEVGVRDGTIHPSGSWEEIYWTAANILTTLTQKLLLYGNLLSPGGNVPPRRQLELACDIILRGLRADPGILPQAEVSRTQVYKNDVFYEKSINL